MAVKPQSDARINAEVLNRLVQLYGAGRLAHAYLFAGPKGSGKDATALAVAQAVNCTAAQGYQPGCRCVSCRKIFDGNHPDMYIVERMEDKNELLIEQVRALIQHLSLRPLEAQVRTAVIKNADLLNTQASNAFLKTLEEPRLGTLLILTSEVPGNILKTVVSRCHMVRFSGQADSKNDIATANAMIEEFILGTASEPLFKKWSADKDAIRGLLKMVLLFYRDVLCVKNGVNDSLLYNKDHLGAIHAVAEQVTEESVQAVLDQAVKTVAAVDNNFNVKVALTILKELISSKGDYGKSISYTGRRV